MKKIVLATMLVSALVASDSGMYVGLDLGNTKFSGDLSWSTGSVDIDGDGTSGTAKVGYYFDGNNRFYGAFQNASLDGANGLSIGLGYDYLIGDNAFKPFVGLLGGYTTVIEDDNDFEDTKGMYYGVQAGLNYAVNQNISLEAGYRFMKANLESTFEDFDGVNTVKVDSLNNWFIGANYRF